MRIEAIYPAALCGADVHTVLAVGGRACGVELSPALARALALSLLGALGEAAPAPVAPKPRGRLGWLSPKRRLRYERALARYTEGRADSLKAAAHAQGVQESAFRAWLRRTGQPP